MIFLGSVIGATLTLSVSLLMVEGSFLAVLLGDQIVQKIFYTYTARNYIRRLDDKILRFNTLRPFGLVSSSECDFDLCERNQNHTLMRTLVRKASVC